MFSECLLLLLFPDRVEMVLLGRQVSDMLMVRRKSKEEGVKGKEKGKEKEKENEEKGKEKYVLQGCLLVLFCSVSGDVFQSLTEKLILGLCHSSNKSLSVLCI